MSERDMKWMAAAGVMAVATSAALGVTIAKDGKTGYTIVVPAGASTVERTAAGELAEHLKLVTGAEFPVAEKAAGPAIRVEVSKDATLGSEGIEMAVRGGDVMLAGGKRGVLYAVETFLEEIVGVRHWTSEESYIPKKPTLEVSDDLNVRYVPKFIYREPFNWDVMGGHYKHAVRMRVNGQHQGIPAEWGGHFSLIGWCHTAFHLIPPGEHFAKHPEWFAMIKGRRQGDTQLCLTNDAMRAELTRKVLAWVRKNPEAGMVSVSQNDTLWPCECERCAAVTKEEGSEAGNWIRFVNAVAAEVAKEYPDFLVETLAYQYSRKPPKVTRPSKNVLVRLCSIEGQFTQPLEAPANASFGDDLRGWAAISPNLFIWNYTTNFSSYLIPHPNYETIGADLRFFAGNKVVGVFEQGDAYNRLAGDMLPLRTWVTAHLLWDPSKDQRKLTEEFCHGYFGPAGGQMLAYLDLINSKSRAGGVKLGCYHDTTAYLSDEEWGKAAELFASAAKAVEGDAAVSKRVRRERLALDLVELKRWKFPKDGDREKAAEVYAEKAEAYVAAARELGVTHYSEAQGFESYVPGLVGRAELLAPPKLPAAGAALPAGKYDIQEDRFSLHRVKDGVSKLVDDPKASNGRAAFMPGGHTEWAVQFHVPKEMAGGGLWKAYVVVRAAGKKEGGVARYGLYRVGHGEVAGGSVGWDVLGDGEYHTIPLHVDGLREGSYFWVSPVGNGNVEGIYVDRVYIERGKRRTK